MTGYLPFTYFYLLEPRLLHIEMCKSAKNANFADLQLKCTIINVYINCKTVNNTKIADLKNIEVEQRII